MLLVVVRGQRGNDGDDSCHNITTEFEMSPNIVYINNNLIGIPNGVQVKITCHCLGRRRPAPEWSYNDNDITATSPNEIDQFSPYIETEGSRAFLRIQAFGEQSSGLYVCHSRDRTEEFNLTWYDPGK